MKRMLCGAAVLLAVLLAGCARQSAPQEVPELLEPVGVKVDTAVVTRADLYTTTVYEGSVVAAAEELSFSIDGKISVVNVWPGKWVEEGDLLFILDQTALEKNMASLQRQIDYMKANGVYDDAAAEMDIELLEMKREKLRGDGADEQALALADLDIEEARQALRQAQEMRALSLSALQEQLKTISADYGRNELRAPFTGNVFYLGNLVEGTSVQADKTVAYIANPDDLTLVITSYLNTDRLIPGSYYALIGGKRYEIEPQPMSMQEMTALLLAGETLPTRFRIVGPEEDLGEVTAGLYAVVCVEGSRVEDALVVPMGALYSAGSERYVYVQTEDGGRERRAVTVGRNNRLDVQILEGLSEGEVVYVKE